ncbi:hypothetical protein SCP_0703150 [Sparassis crispa]|uniref:Uncharacterized protein n=1 Tax=Sparassis crispa TaxID=139825 RepID=A0A401GSI5_9APHY|nr:hypothetical protein SCP_0703150 [Sparassis crispa]GBE85129.1 hypothetical protein SCP_0703150 [Sparassis crispa]
MVVPDDMAEEFDDATMEDVGPMLSPFKTSFSGEKQDEHDVGFGLPGFGTIVKAYRAYGCQ